MLRARPSFLHSSKKQLIFSWFVSGWLALQSGIAHAESILGVAPQFNAFVEGDFTASATDIQGTLAAGGNVKLESYGIAATNPVPASSYSLIAGNSITYGNGQIFHGSIIAGGSVAGISAGVRNVMQTGASITGGAVLPVNFSAEFANLRQISTALSNVPSTATVEYKWGGTYITGDCLKDVQVINLDGQKLLDSTYFNLTCVPTNATVIVNVSGVAPGIRNASVEPFSPYKTKTLFNFFQATSVTFSSVGIKGSVLAPFAVITNPTGHIDGTLIAKSWSGPMELHHFPFVGNLNFLANHPPVITSSPVNVALEATQYQYDVEATDEDIKYGDILNYSLTKSPADAVISSLTGLVQWTPTADYVASVSEKNSQCYVVPVGSVGITQDPSAVNTNVYIAPLFQQVKVALQNAGAYTAVEAKKWDTNNNCFGCHVQTQALVGLETSLEKADVDKTITNYFLTGLLNNQAANGSLSKRNHPEYAKTQTALALWALDQNPDRALTLAVRAKALDYFWGVKVQTANNLYWVNDHNTGWVNGPLPTSALVAFAVSGLLDDAASNKLTLTADQRNTAEVYRAQLPAMAAYFLAGAGADTDILPNVFRMIALSELSPHITNNSLKIQIDQAIANIDKKLRLAQHSDGGWGTAISSQQSDPLITAWVGLALNYLDPSLADPVVIKTIQYLLKTQLAGGTWKTTSGLFVQSDFGATSLVMAYLPVALDHLGNPDLRVGDFSLEADKGIAKTLGVSITNRGIADAKLPATVAIYDGFKSGGKLLGRVAVPALATGAEFIAKVQVPDSGFTAASVYAELEDVTNLDECEIRNNSNAAALFGVKVTDRAGLTDAQIYVLNVHDVNTPPAVAEPSVSIIMGTAQSLSRKIAATDSDVGDALAYRAVNAPKGISIDPRTGRLYSDPLLAVAGTYQFTVEVEDLRGGKTQQIINLTLQANLPPIITSVPAAQNPEGKPYSYQVVATDPNGDELKYGFRSAFGAMDPQVGRLEFLSGAPVMPLRGDNPFCEKAPSSAPLLPVNKWSLTSVNSHPVQVFGPVLVGQLSDDNGDGVIDSKDDVDIIFHNSTNTSLVAVTGKTGALLWENTTAGIARWGSSALGDIDRDGIVDIVAVANDRKSLMAFNNRGQLKWKVAINDAPAMSDPRDAIAVADLDHDGTPEIIHGRSVYSNTGVKKASGAFEQGGDTAYGIVSIVADIDMDQNLDIVAGRAAYKKDGTLLWRKTELPATGFNAVGNFNNDSFPEVVFVGGGRVALLDHLGNILWNVALPGGGEGGAPTVADVDGDGKPDIGVAGGSNYVVFNQNGSIKWKQPTQDLSSHRTGSSVFDFEGDGKAEIVYADEKHLFIFDGQTGTPLYAGNNFSGTTLEYPVIADIDGDNQAEILYGGNESSTQGLYALESGSDPWAPTRAIWNEHSYHINNINDDGSIPQFELPSWLTHNTYRLNTFLDRKALAQADLTVTAITYNDRTQTLTAEIRNRGLAPVDKAIDVEFLGLTGLSSFSSLGHASVANLAAGATATAVLTSKTPAQLGRQVQVKVQTATSECLLSNNDAVAQVIDVVAQDPGLLAATQTYLYSSTNINEVPSFTSPAVSTLVADSAFNFELKATDPDKGDMVRYSLVDAPAGVKLNSFTGVLTAPANQFAPGIYNIRVAAKDTSAAQVEQVLVLTVSQPNNLKPEFVSQPVTIAPGQRAYIYNAVAQDPDGDQIVYSLSEAPAGMYVDGSSGVVHWTPSLSQVGSHIVDIKVVDSRGASESQRFVLEVTDPNANNRAPSITSEPTGAVVVGKVFGYQVAATDPDGDQLTYTMSGMQSGMSFDAQGLFSWLPGVDQANKTVAVTFTVRDGRGGEASQSLILPVNEAANNPPAITSEPVMSASADTLYSYQVLANDVDGDTLSYQLTTKPNGMEITPTGLVKWTPSSLQSGKLSAVEVRVVDARGAAAMQQFQIAVGLPPVVNTLPKINSIPAAPAVVGLLYQYAVKAVDAEGNPLTYSLVGDKPSGLSISATGLLSWTPTSAQLGTYNIAVRVSDGYGSVTQTYSLPVVPQPDLTNAYPEITSMPLTETKAGNAYTYQVSATDADGDPLTYELVSAPQGVAFTAAGKLTWTPGLANLGSAQFTVRVSDGKSSDLQSWDLQVVDGRIPLSIKFGSSATIVNKNDPVTLTLIVNGGSEAPVVNYTLDASPGVLDAFSQSVVSFTTSGLHTAKVVVTSGGETKAAEVSILVRDPSDTVAPIASITSPTNTGRITAPTDILGTVTDDHLISYELLVSPKDKGQWESIAKGSAPVVNGKLASVDPTLMQNGIYDLQLVALDINGKTTSVNSVIVVDGDMKLGNYSISFEDVNVPLAGIPIRVTRTYDTRQKSQKLDFGYGWSVDYQNVRVQESRKLGFSWNLNYYRSGFFGKYCVEPSGNPIVTITLPDGSVERFKAKANPDCTQLVPTIDVGLTFEPQGATRSTLEQTDYGNLRLANGNIIDMGDELTMENGVDPNGYKLTTKDGMVYFLDQAFGIRKIQEPGGQTITYSSGGIKHSLGYQIKFERDSNNRITALLLPDGRKVSYSYNANGDLTSVTDLSGNITRFAYQAKQAHYLTDITDPRGVKATRMEYDDEGRLIAIVDADGNRVEYTHNIAGRSEMVRDTRGNSTVYIYDDEGHVLSETNALGETVTRTYNTVGDVLSETNALGKTTSWTYDSRGNQISETDPLGNITRHTYMPNGLALTETNALGVKVFTNTYDERALTMTSTTDALGNKTTFAWDTGLSSCATGASKGYTDALGNTHSIGVLCFGPLAGLAGSETNAEGIVTTYGYDSSGRKIREKTTRTINGQATELVTSYVYDSEDRVVQTTLPDGSITKTEYNAIGKVAAEVDIAGLRTEYVYDARGNEIEVHHADGSITSKTYDAANNVTSETDVGGNVTRYTYDAANRKLSTTYADGSVSRSEYDAAGRVVVETDARGNSTHYGYDDAGRRTSVEDALGNVTLYEYDAAGRLISTTDALGHKTRYEYNARDQRVKTILPDGSEVKDEFDAISRRSAHIDAAQHKTVFVFDKLGKLTQVTDALNNLTRYGYDEAGNKISQTDAEGRVTQWGYDKSGRNTSRTLPLGESESQVYNAQGQLTSHTDFKGQVSQYTYNSQQRVSRIDYADGTAEAFTYDAFGNRKTAQQVSGAVTATSSWVYDSRNRLVSETQPNGAVLSYTYDANGNRTQVQLVQGNTTQTTSYSYDVLNRLESVTTLEGVTTYGYDAVGNRTSVSYPNGTSQVYSYDQNNRLITLKTYGKQSALVEQYDYILNAIGQRTLIKELSGRSTAYEYDDLGRLTKETITDATNGNRTTSYTYDKVGNRLTEVVDGVTTTSVYDNNDRITSAGATTYTYDANGSTLVENNGGVATSYSYNAKNQLASTTNAQGVTQYAYNIDGIRISQSLGTTNTVYVVDSNRDYAQVLNEITGNTSITYTYGDDLISQNKAGQTAYYHYDGLGSTRQLSNTQGNFTDGYHYQAFGKLLNKTGTTDNKYLFTGEQYDNNLNQYYLRARYYNQNNGRFTQMDTYAGNSQDPVTLHKYLYANADGVNKIDPSGNMTLGDMSAAQSVSATLSRIAVGTGRLIQILDKVDTAVSLYQSRSALLRAFSYIKSDGFESSVKGDKGFAYELENYEDGLSVLCQNFYRIMAGLEKSSKVREFVKSPKNDLIIYGPTPHGGYPWFPTGTRLTIGSMTLGKGSRKILVELGTGAGQGGRFIGLGHTQGARKVDHTQWFRMDWHEPDGAEQWRSMGYHFHLKP
jgi:choice-of-anchor A domain-containing protein/RHS repeat-associated protein